MIEWIFKKVKHLKDDRFYGLGCFEIDSNIKLEHFLDVLKKQNGLNGIKMDDWYYLLEDVRKHREDNSIHQRVFSSLIANQITRVQPMKTPVGLAYAMRIIYDEDSND